MFSSEFGLAEFFSTVNMRFHLLLALACNTVISMDDMGKLEQSTEHTGIQPSGYLKENSRKRYAATPKASLEKVQKYSYPIDDYIKLFDYPIQAANGCITGNKLQGLDPVECIKLVTNPIQTDEFHYHDSHRQSLTNAQLEVLIFNAIEVRNIPVLNELLRIRVLHESIEWSFLQDAFCWALISEKLNLIDDFHPKPTSIADFPGNEACDSLNQFASSRENEITLSDSVTVSILIYFHENLVESNYQLNNLFFYMKFEFERCEDLLIERPYPTNRFKLYKGFINWENRQKCLEKLMQMGALAQKGSICSAVKRFDKDSLFTYFKSGLLVDWDFEMDCISKIDWVMTRTAIKTALIDSTIREMEMQYLFVTVPPSYYHGLKN